MAIYAIMVKLLLSAAQFMGAFGAEGIFLTHCGEIQTSF
jgi:hypothetical protein